VPKIKTHKSTAKRLTVTGNGKIMRLKSRRSHLRRNRSKRVKRLYDRKLEIQSRSHKTNVRQLAPYLK
jgi:large subunit ribosomal protein L35